MRIAVIDNYDSFTYNLVHIVEKINPGPVDVYRNDELCIDDLREYNGIILSPGPGIPDEAGLLKDIISNYFKLKPILGICLGMQAIAEVFGGSLINLPKVYHGVGTDVVVHKPLHYLFDDIPEQFVAGRYHSWVVNPADIPGELGVIATDKDDIIMGLAHKDYDLCGLQFHPESILTPDGVRIMSNWLTRLT